MRSCISSWATVILAAIALILCIAVQESLASGTALSHSSSTGWQEEEDGVRRITVAELRQALEKGAAVVVDVRSEEAYKAGHIKGARLIPVDEIAGRVKELPRNKMIITYCS